MGDLAKFGAKRLSIRPTITIQIIAVMRLSKLPKFAQVAKWALLIQEINQTGLTQDSLRGMDARDFEADRAFRGSVGGIFREHGVTYLVHLYCNLAPNSPHFLPQIDLKTPKPNSKDSNESLLFG
ncbi:MAG TPA: hypothetical protein V6D18_16730 [Thermosynechococcaceae cyanobacterium]